MIWEEILRKNYFKLFLFSQTILSPRLHDTVYHLFKYSTKNETKSIRKNNFF